MVSTKPNGISRSQWIDSRLYEWYGLESLKRVSNVVMQL